MKQKSGRVRKFYFASIQHVHMIEIIQIWEAMRLVSQQKIDNLYPANILLIHVFFAYVCISKILFDFITLVGLFHDGIVDSMAYCCC